MYNKLHKYESIYIIYFKTALHISSMEWSIKYENNDDMSKYLNAVFTIMKKLYHKPFLVAT